MVNDLAKLYNTLKLIDTKGDSTIYMADCLRFIEQMIAKAKSTEEAVMENGS